MEWRARQFHLVIEKYPLLPVFARMNLQDFSAALEEAHSSLMHIGISNDFQVFRNPYVFLLRHMIDMFHERRDAFAKQLPLDEKVDFIFDNQSEKSHILTAWDAIVAGHLDQVKERFGATPRFEDDQEFLPLQAADFWAWWVREWFEEDSPPTPEVPDKMKQRDFGSWRGNKQMPIFSLSYDQSILVACLKGLAFGVLPHARTFRMG